MIIESILNKLTFCDWIRICMMAEKQNKKHTVRGGSGKETRDKKNPRIPS